MRPLLALLLATVFASPIAAQTRERGYVAVNAGVQGSAGGFSDRFNYVVNAEDAVTDARYSSASGLLFDGGAGVQVWKTVGVGVHVSRSSISGVAQTDSQIPHPLFDDRDRQVSGEAADLSRRETAVHMLLYYSRSSGPWRIRFAGGPSFFRLEQEVVTGIVLDETYPYDTATFRSAATARGKDSAVGFNVGADVSRMFTPRLGAGALVRYARGSIDFNVDAGHRVSTDAGGAQLGVGLRFSF